MQAKPFNRMLFLACVAVTGAVAGAFVWLFFLAMEHGITFIWTTVPAWLGQATAEVMPAWTQGPFGFLPYPFIVCILGGLAIGLYERSTHIKTEDLNTVMGKVKKTGRYEYDSIGKLSIAALLPLLFGGSIGPEAGLTGVIAGLCTWVGDRLRRFGADFKELTTLGTQAALTALFTAPLYGVVAPLAGTADGDVEHATIELPRVQKIVTYTCAVAGALGAYMGLGQLFGGGMGMPHFDAATVGTWELVLLVPLALAGTACGWLFHASELGFENLAARLGDRPVMKGVLAGLLLAICGSLLPFALFSGETQSDLLIEGYATVPAFMLIATGYVKAALTPACISLGWRGGHFFPVIFAGVCLGFGFARLTGADPAFCVAACTAATMASVMRQPLMVVLLLFLCFPPRGVAVMLAAAVIGAAIPLPKALHSRK